MSTEKLTPEQQRNALSTLAAVIEGLAEQTRDAKVILGQFDESLLDVDAVRTEHIGLSLGWALDNLRTALYSVESLATRVDRDTLLPLPLRTYMRDNDEPPAAVTALSYASNGKTKYVVRNPAGGWDLTSSLGSTLPPTSAPDWSMTTKHINVTMTEVRR